MTVGQTVKTGSQVREGSRCGRSAGPTIRLRPRNRLGLRCVWDSSCLLRARELGRLLA